ncbi:MAG: 2OG-Fe(II) oxygenase, partial [Pseudonocardiaceae bacterium]
MSSNRSAAQLTPAADLTWSELGTQLDGSGFALTAPILTPQQCAEVVGMFDEQARFRSTITMARHAYGEGIYRYFADPLPDLVQALRESFYPHLA